MKRPGPLAFLSAALLALTLVLAPTPSRATENTAEPETLQNAVRYAGCAVGIVAATTGLGILGAVMFCATLFVDEAR